MSTEFPPRKISDDTNPYSPPAAALDVELVDLIPSGDLAAAEAVRRAHSLLSAKATTIFSAEYMTIIARTPYIRYRMSLLLKFFLGLLVAILVAAVISAVVALLR